MTDKRALIAIDDDDEVRTLKTLTRAWSAAPGSYAIILGVAPSLSAAMTSPKVVSLAKDAEGMLLNDLRDRIEELREEIDGPSEQHLVCGRATDEIIKAAVLHEADLVIKAADRAVGEKSPMFGAVEKKLIRKCPTPVWIVRTETAEPPQRIAIAVDNATAAANKAESELLAASLLNHAADLAQRFGVGEVSVIHAWSAHAVSFLSAPRSGLSSQDIKDYINEWKGISESWLDTFVAEANARFGARGFSFKPHLTMGDARTEIPAAADRLRVDLLVMGSANRSGVPGLFIGNTAEGVIDRLSCSVYVVKPEGFASVLAPNIG